MKHSHNYHARAGHVARLNNSLSTIKVLILAILISGFGGIACHGAADASRPSSEKARTFSQFVAGIVARSGELIYISEQDSDVVVFYRNTRVEEITDSVFLSLLRRPAGAPIQQQSWSAFFQSRISTDPSGQWAMLRQYLEANLTNLTVFRLPRDGPYSAQYDLYVVGLFSGNIVVGVQMFGVAT